jgi:hypothetical protein
MLIFLVLRYDSAKLENTSLIYFQYEVPISYRLQVLLNKLFLLPGIRHFTGSAHSEFSIFMLVQVALFFAVAILIQVHA